MQKAFFAVISILTLASCGRMQPTAQSSPTASESQCSKDTDCKGERICDSGICVYPNSVTAPTSVQPSVSSSPSSSQGNKFLSDGSPVPEGADPVRWARAKEQSNQIMGAANNVPSLEMFCERISDKPAKLAYQLVKDGLAGKIKIDPAVGNDGYLGWPSLELKIVNADMEGWYLIEEPSKPLPVNVLNLTFDAVQKGATLEQVRAKTRSECMNRTLSRNVERM